MDVPESYLSHKWLKVSQSYKAGRAVYTSASPAQ